MTNYKNQFTEICPPPPKTKAGKLWSLEFLRIIFLIFIFFTHPFAELLNLDDRSLRWFEGNFAVNGFLILSGFLLYRTAMSSNAPTFKGFFVKQWLRLAPVLIVVCLLGIAMKIVFGFGYNRGLLPTCFLLLFTGNGLAGYFPQFYGVIWYVGCLFWGGLIVYYMLRNFDMKKNLFAFAIIAYLVLVFEWNEGFNSLVSTMARNFMLRTIGGLMLGAIVAHICSTIKRNDKLWYKIFFTVMEIGLIFYVFWGASRGSLPIIDQIPFLDKFDFMRGNAPNNWNIHNAYSYIFLSLLVLIFALNCGYISRFLNSQSWINHVSRYAYSFLATMGIALRIARSFHATNFFVLLGINIIMAVAVYWAVEYWAIKLANKYRNMVSSKDTERSV